jgi:hypothetical protein
VLRKKKRARAQELYNICRLKVELAKRDCLRDPLFAFACTIYLLGSHVGILLAVLVGRRCEDLLDRIWQLELCILAMADVSCDFKVEVRVKLDRGLSNGLRARQSRQSVDNLPT